MASADYARRGRRPEGTPLQIRVMWAVQSLSFFIVLFSDSFGSEIPRRMA